MVVYFSAKTMDFYYEYCGHVIAPQLDNGYLHYLGISLAYIAGQTDQSRESYMHGTPHW